MPIVLPTEERVAAMLKGTSHAPDEVVGRLSPTGTLFKERWEITVEKVAVNAVMAGAKPECLPVILALAASVRSGPFQQHDLDGGERGRERPIRNEIGMSLAESGCARAVQPPPMSSRSVARTVCCR